MKPSNRLTEKLVTKLAEKVIIDFTEAIDDALEKAWHEGYTAGLEAEE